MIRSIWQTAALMLQLGVFLVLVVLERYPAIPLLSSICLVVCLYRAKLFERIILFCWGCIMIASGFFLSLSLVVICILGAILFLEAGSYFIKDQRMRLVGSGAILGVSLALVAGWGVTWWQVWYVIAATSGAYIFLAVAWNAVAPRKELIIQ